MAKENKVNEKVKNKKLQLYAEKFLATLLTLVTTCVVVSAQQKEDREKKDRAGARTEAKAILSDIAAIEVSPDKVLFYNDCMIGGCLDITKGESHFNATATELVIYDGGEASTLSNRMLLSFEQKTDEGLKWFIETGHKPEQLEQVFFNGVPFLNYDMDSKSLPVFGNLTEITVFGMEKNGLRMCLGAVSPYGDDWLILANMSDPTLYINATQTLKNEGWTFSISGTAEHGQINKVFGSISAHNDKVGFALGGNYDSDTKISNTYARATYTSLKSGMTYVAQTLKKGETYCFQVGAGKKGMQAFATIDNVTASSKQKTTFKSTPTVNFGVSYNISNGR